MGCQAALLSGTLFAVIFAPYGSFSSRGQRECLWLYVYGRVSTRVDDYLVCPKQRVNENSYTSSARVVLTAILVCFVDILKELPATLILRPFDFNTLAVRAYELAGQAFVRLRPHMYRIGRLVPVILLNRSIRR